MLIGRMMINSWILECHMVRHTMWPWRVMGWPSKCRMASTITSRKNILLGSVPVVEHVSSVQFFGFHLQKIGALPQWVATRAFHPEKERLRSIFEKRLAAELLVGHFGFGLRISHGLWHFWRYSNNGHGYPTSCCFWVDLTHEFNIFQRSKPTPWNYWWMPQQKG